jgi:hypothetical protein
MAATPLNATLLAPSRFVPEIVTVAPGAPDVGANDVMDGAGVALKTVKSEALVAVPAGVVTVIFPLTASWGTAALIWVLEPTLNTVETPPIVTVLVPSKFVPVIVIVAPGRPAVGENDETVGGPATSKLDADVAAPHGVVTEIGPLAAPCGTEASILVADTTLNTADVPPNVTAFVPVKFVPSIVTVVPGCPATGENEEIVGGGDVDGTVKSDVLVAVPPGVVTAILPLVAFWGTDALICVADVTLKTAVAPPKVTAVAPVKFVPVIATVVPGAPETGENEPTVGGGGGGGPARNVSELVAVPVTFVTAIGPLTALSGTTTFKRSSETTWNAAATPPIVTLLVAPKLVPRTVTLSPEVPEEGVKEAIVGAFGATGGDPTSQLAGEVLSPARNAHVPRNAGVPPSQC